MLRLLTIPAALVVLLLAAMTWSGSATEKPASFRFINRGNIITLDPNQMSYLQDIRMGFAMWEGLYAYDALTLDPLPGVAKGADINDAKTVYTFHLRDDAKWSDGSPVVAGDVVFGWKRMLDEPGEYTYLHYYIRVAEGYGNRA